LSEAYGGCISEYRCYVGCIDEMEETNIREAMGNFSEEFSARVGSRLKMRWAQVMPRENRLPKESRHKPPVHRSEEYSIQS